MAETKKLVVSKPTKVVALSDGFFRGSRRRKGVKFVVPAGTKLGGWMEIVNEPVTPGEATTSTAAVLKPELARVLSKAVQPDQDDLI
jgi:hypothetical protein